jgi:predicted ATP-dependent serine protease
VAEPFEFTEWKHLTDDTRDKYHRYLCSREWAEKRRAVLHRSEGVCERCQLGKVEEIHHLTYDRKYDEHLDDLQGLCAPCHEYVHGHSDFDPRKTATVKSLLAERVPREAILTGLPSLDEHTGGLFPGEFIVVASRPAMGKSALVQNIAQVASKASHVLIFNLEMNRHEVLN